jgi:hypothetical protein
MEAFEAELWNGVATRKKLPVRLLGFRATIAGIDMF